MCQQSECKNGRVPKPCVPNESLLLRNGWNMFFHLVLRCCQLSPFQQGNLFGIVLDMPALAGCRRFLGQLTSHGSTILSNT
jgi:hypothetical protein